MRVDLTVFEDPVDPANKSFFSEIIASISDVRFSHDGCFFLSRDYLTAKARAFMSLSLCVCVYEEREIACGM